MVMRLFLIYAVVEMAVIVALTATIGFGWTILLLAGTFLAGLALAGSQTRRHVQRLQAGLSGAGTRGQLGLATDSLLVALGTVLMVVPGLASSLVGALLLLPPTRAAVRPLATALAARKVAFITTGVSGAGAAANGYRAYRDAYPGGRADYIDGEVIDVDDPAAGPTGYTQPPALERKPD